MSFLGSRRTVLRRNLPTVALLLIIGAAAVWTCTTDPFEDWRLSLTDSFVPNEDASRAITIVAIDNATLERYGRFELWPRTLHAEAIRRLDDAGARVIAYDILFSEDDEEDAAFRDAVADATVVLAVAGDGPMTVQSDGTASFPILVSPGANLSAAAAGLGHVNVVPDRDARVRQIPATIAADGETFPALSAIAVERFLEPTERAAPLIDAGELTVGDLDVPLDDGLFRIAYAGNVQRFQVVSFSDVMGDDGLPTSLTAGRLVVVGVTAIGVGDFFQTPAGSMPGVVVHANAMDALIKGRFLEVVPLASLTAIGFLVAAVCAVVMTRRSLTVGAGAAFGFGVAYIVAAWLLPITGRIIDPVYIPGLLALGIVTSLGWRFVGARAEGLFFRSWFERVAPAEIVEELGEETALTVLIEHHSIVRNQVAAHSGREVKNLGDGFLLEFPSARDAIDCAAAIQQALDDYNRSGPPRPVRVRCGITVGEPLRHGPDLFGRCIVLASRIVNEAHGGEILVSAELKDEVGPSAGVNFGRRWAIQAKGLRGAQSVFEVNWKPAQEDDRAPARYGMRQAASSDCRATEAIYTIAPATG